MLPALILFQRGRQNNFELLTDALEELRCRVLRRYNTLLPSWAGNFGGIGRNRNRKGNMYECLTFLYPSEIK